ncbi:MAG: hypothetical protein ABR526_08775 [Chthoniobacterales bacterium]
MQTTTTVRVRYACIAGLLLLPSIAPACMVCDTELGHQVRRGVFDGNFGSTALAVLLPFPAFLLAAAAVHYGVPKLITPTSKTEEKDPT